MKDSLNPEKRKQKEKLDVWKEKYQKSKDAYADALNRMRNQDRLYSGDAFTRRSKNKGAGEADKLSENVRNISYELLETEVDSSIPMPKVTAKHEEDQPLADAIEQMFTVGQQSRRKKPRQNCKHRPQARHTRTVQAQQHSGQLFAKYRLSEQ